jgi:uncharacterized membrane protein
MDEINTQGAGQQTGDSQQPPVPKADPQDVEKNKALAIIGYILPILFFVPLITEAKNSPFAKFHANQQLNLLLFSIVGSIASSVLVIVLIGMLLYPLVLIASIAFMILGVINAVNGEMKRLPVIGGFALIK